MTQQGIHSVRCHTFKGKWTGDFIQYQVDFDSFFFPRVVPTDKLLITVNKYLNTNNKHQVNQVLSQCHNFLEDSECWGLLLDHQGLDEVVILVSSFFR